MEVIGIIKLHEGIFFISNLSKEILRNYIKEQNFTSPDEILDAMKDMFKDILQETLEAEMDKHLGYDKYDISEKQTRNSRNGYSKKTIKSELGPRGASQFFNSGNAIRY